MNECKILPFERPKKRTRKKIQDDKQNALESIFEDEKRNLNNEERIKKDRADHNEKVKKAYKLRKKTEEE